MDNSKKVTKEDVELETFKKFLRNRDLVFDKNLVDLKKNEPTDISYDGVNYQITEGDKEDVQRRRRVTSKGEIYIGIRSISNIAEFLLRGTLDKKSKRADPNTVLLIDVQSTGGRDWVTLTKELSVWAEQNIKLCECWKQIYLVFPEKNVNLFSKEELLDIVDENNIPTGESKPRSLVHTDGDWHRVVHVYFVGPDGRLLVHLRSLKKDLHPGRWDTRFGGHVPSGMGVDEAVLKELGEEVGIAAEPERLIRGQIKKHDGTTNREFVYVFFYRFAGDIGDLSFDDGEVTEVRWMKPEQIIADIEAQPEKWASTREVFIGILRQISGIISESSSV